MDDLPLQIRNALQKLTATGEELSHTRFLLAVSGGKDSMVMAHCFLALKLNFGIAHFNFQLRGEASDRDQELITLFCRNHQIPFHIKSENTQKASQNRNRSIQETARELRYEFFDDILSKEDYQYICTAHHGNDQLETLFIHLFRGSGLKGLSGIPEKRDQILRPMLWIPHQTISQYAEKHNVPYRDDETNKSDKYLRNRIRHHLIDPITKWDESYLTKSLHSISLITEYQSYISSQLNKYINHSVRKLTPEIEQIQLTDEMINDPSQLFLLKLYLLECNLFPHSIEDFMDASGQWKTGACYEGQNLKAWYDRNLLWIIKDSFYDHWDPNDVIDINPGKAINLPHLDSITFHDELPESGHTNSWIVPIKEDEISLPLRMRHRQPGDYIELGTPPYFRKSIKKLLNEYRIPRPFKDRLYVLTDAKNKIIALPGITNSPKYTTNTTPDLIIEYRSDLEFLFDQNTH